MNKWVVEAATILCAEENKGGNKVEEIRVRKIKSPKGYHNSRQRSALQNNTNNQNNSAVSRRIFSVINHITNIKMPHTYGS